jgi:hypothetical protein
MRPMTKLLIAAPLSAGLLAAPAAHADWYRPGWRGGYGWRPHYEHHHGNPGRGAIIAGTVLGLGAAAVIAGALAPPPPPPVYFAPPPPVVYAPPPAYYAQPPAYYAPPSPYAPY